MRSFARHRHHEGVTVGCDDGDAVVWRPGGKPISYQTARRARTAVVRLPAFARLALNDGPRTIIVDHGGGHGIGLAYSQAGMALLADARERMARWIYMLGATLACSTMRLSGMLEHMRRLVAQISNPKTVRKLIQSSGPYCLAAVILPGGFVLVPLVVLFRRRKAALKAAMIRTSVTVRSNLQERATVHSAADSLWWPQKCRGRY